MLVIDSRMLLKIKAPFPSSNIYRQPRFLFHISNLDYIIFLEMCDMLCNCLWKLGNVTECWNVGSGAKLTLNMFETFRYALWSCIALWEKPYCKWIIDSANIHWVIGISFYKAKLCTMEHHACLGQCRADYSVIWMTSSYETSNLVMHP